MISMAGMNPRQWLFCTDPFERSAMLAVAEQRRDTAAEERQDLADRIINALSAAMKKK